jgi:hypothetical protein
MVTTNAIVPMGDNQSLAKETMTSWNTMGGQLTGNVVDHLPVMNFLSYDDSANTVKEGKVNNEVEGGKDEQTSSSNITVYTSNAIKDDSSVLTLVPYRRKRSNINKVVDNIPTFAGGGGGRSIASGITNQVVRLIPPHGGARGGVGGGGDDRSVASYGTWWRPSRAAMLALNEIDDLVLDDAMSCVVHGKKRKKHDPFLRT